MHVLAIGDVRWGKVTVHGMELDPNDNNYYSGSGETLVLIQMGNVSRVDRVLFAGGSELRQEYVYPAGGKLYSKNLGMYVNGNYTEGEYVVSTPIGINADKLPRDTVYWPWKPDGSRVVYCTTSQMDLSDAVAQGQMLGKFEDELRGLIGSHAEAEYLAIISELLKEAPSSTKESERPLWAALNWMQAELRGKL